MALPPCLSRNLRFLAHLSVSKRICPPVLPPSHKLGASNADRFLLLSGTEELPLLPHQGDHLPVEDLSISIRLSLKPGQKLSARCAPKIINTDIADSRRCFVTWLRLLKGGGACNSAWRQMHCPTSTSGGRRQGAASKAGRECSVWPHSFYDAIHAIRMERQRKRKRKRKRKSKRKRKRKRKR